MRSGSHSVMSLSGRTLARYPSNHKIVRPSSLLEFPFVRLLNILHVAAPFVLSNGDGKAGQSMQPTLYLTITVSANIASPILPDNIPIDIPIEGDDSPAEEVTNPSTSPDSRGPIQSTVLEPHLPSSGPLPVETGTPIPDSEKVVIAIRRADEAMKSIDLANTWKGAVSGIKLVMDSVNQVAEVRAISILSLLD